MSFRWLIALAVATLPAVGSAEESNQKEVRAANGSGGWQVAYGRMVTETERAMLNTAIASAISTGNSTPVLAYIEDFASGTVGKLAEKVPEVSRDVLLEHIKRAISKPGGILLSGRLEVRFGVAKYQRWKLVTVSEPKVRMTRREKRIYGRRIVWHEPEPYMAIVESRIPLPDWHQPYVAIRAR